MKGHKGLFFSIGQTARPAASASLGRDSEAKTVAFGCAGISLNGPPSAGIGLNQPD
ncbi:hypothetical protein LJB86_02080 [Deltaproteobacteria bacterium OttesenSCG-928-M10]|nr:hypothetical protein [Deltaproteobacteria bacterium OttesenSCG-928-M10]